MNVATKLSYGVGQLSDGVKQSAFGTFLFFYYNQENGERRVLHAGGRLSQPVSQFEC